MANLTEFYTACDVPAIPSMEGVLQLLPLAEFTAMPATRADNGGTVLGDKKIYDAPWPYVSTQGLGYWRRYRIHIDSAELMELGEGEVGFLTNRNRLPFFLKGSGAAINEIVDELRACSGCVIGMIQSKAGDHFVIGNRNNPVYFEPYEGGIKNDKVGYPMSLFCNTGSTSMIYDAATHGINYTPNP